jgi:benzoyl-CoA reductase/2-hydroxyglutaryl-CoA dehydratase subunit BcrC/BadD/HgdB
MNAIAYSSPFVPAEWIAAHGFRPHRLRLRATERLTRGVCPYAGALIAEKGSELFSAASCPLRSDETRPFPYSALVLTTTCDQMRYAAAMLEQRGERVFLLNVPSTWQTPASRQLYLDEIRRLGRFLVSLGGKTPTDSDLSQIMLDTGRSQENENNRPTESGEPVGIPLAILGGPLMENDREFFELIERAGGRIVLDATEDGERALPRPFDPARVAADPLTELADAYFDGIPDAFRRPNTPLYDWLGREMTARHIRGIILRRYLWCDLWHAELQRLKQWSPAPVLEIDVGPDDIASPNRVQGRVEAFLETLK